MKKVAVVSLVLFITSALMGLAAAAEETITIEGDMICARCTLKEEGLTACQNVVAVKADGGVKHYYMVKNDADHEFGEVCMESKPVRVTGTVAEKDGKMWITATEIVPTKEG